MYSTLISMCIVLLNMYELLQFASPMLWWSFNTFFFFWWLKFLADEELSEEVARLRNLQQGGNFSRLKDSKTDNGGACTPASGQVSEEAGNRSQRRKTHKRRRQSLSETEDIVMPSSSLQDDEILRESEKDLHKGAVPSGSLITVQQVSDNPIEVYILSRNLLSPPPSLTNVFFQPQCCRAIERPGMCLRFWNWGYCYFTCSYGVGVILYAVFFKVAMLTQLAKLTACFKCLLSILWI